LNLKSQTIRGAFWTFTDILLNKGSYFFATIILAKILGPKEFGILGMITLFITLGNVLIDGGMSTSLIRKTEVTQIDYDTIFVSSIIMSVFIYLIFYLIAPFVANFYNEPLLINVLRYYSIGIVINSLRIIHLIKLTKEMDFKKITLLNLPGNIISIILAIWMSYSNYGIWSLVVLFLSNQIISTFLFWSFIKWAPTWRFDFSNFKYHFKFGYKLILSSQLNAFFDNLYNIIIGKFYDIKLLGYYERSYTFNSYPVSVLSGLIQKVSLPSLSLIKEDTFRLQNAYKNIMQVAFLISTSGLAFSSLFAQEIIYILLGEKWLPMVPIFQILSISFIFYPIHSLNINILSVFGRSDLFLKLEIIKKISFFIVILVSFKFGINGLIWSNVFNSFFALIINTYYSGKFLNYPTKQQLIDLLPTIGVVLITLFTVYFFKYASGSLNAGFQILLSFLIGLFVLISTSEIIGLTPYKFLKNLLLIRLK
jgi:O-antigen/teichoic acid export membrane protein